MAGGQAGQSSPRGLACECSGKEGRQKGGAGKWAHRAGSSSVDDPVAGGLKTPLFQLSTQRPGGRVLGAVWLSCPGLSSQPDPAPFSPLSPHLPAQMKGVCVWWWGGGVCVCVCSKLFTLCKYIRKKFLMEVAPGRTEVSLGAEVVTATPQPLHLPHAQVLDDILEQLHGTHDVLVLRGERGREARSALGGWGPDPASPCSKSH